MALVEVRLKINRDQMGAWADEVQKLGAQRSYAKLVDAAQFMERRVDVNLRSSGMILDRSSHRRKHGAPRIINSIRARVDGTPQRFPMRLVLEPKPGVSHKKVASLEKGTRGHTMELPVLFPRAQRFSKTGKKIGRTVGPQRTRHAYGKNDGTSKVPVEVGSRKGYHFMEKSYKETIQALRSGRISP